jgi:O-antigen/teichoic acid export membrane protein
MRLGAQSLASSMAGSFRIGLLIVVQPLLLRFLGTQQYGVWALLNVVLSVALLADTGLTQSVTALLPRERRDGVAEPVVVPVTLALLVSQGLVVSIAIMLLAAPIVTMLLGQPDAEATLALRIIGATVVPRLLQQWLGGYEAGLMKYEVFAVAESTAIALQYGGLVVLAIGKASLSALATWLLAMTIASLAIHWLALRRPIPRGVRFPDRKQWRDVLSFGYSFWITSVALILFSQVDRLVINAVLGVDAVAIYAVATGIGTKINELAGLPLRPMLPYVSGSAQPGQIRRAFVGGTIACAVVVTVVTAAVTGLAPFLAAVISETHARDLGILIAVIATIYGIYSLSAPGYLTLLGLRRVRFLAWTVWAGFVSTIVLIWFLARFSGLTAAAWGNAGYCIVLIMAVVAARASGASVPMVLTINAIAVAVLLLFYGVVSTIGTLSLPLTIALLAAVSIAVILAGYLAARRWGLAGRPAARTEGAIPE